jgi:phosphoribosylaminoimidazole-succinocarboxamide synthase
MTIDADIRAQLPHTLKETDFPGLGSKYRGKVRDVYDLGDRLVIVTTDRVSAFDHVLGTIPFKGQILNGIALAAFEATSDIAPNHLISVPDPNVVVAKKCKAFPIEMVVRGYLTGSLWRDYQEGKAGVYGVPLPADMKKDQPFSTPILTPTTKAAVGTHDQPISQAEIVSQGILQKSELDEAAALAMKLYARGQALAAKRGLILVDTKYEMGRDADGKLTVIDEIHTPDSSRYWIASSYAARFAAGESPQMLDKENLRGWLIEKHGFKGHGTPPPLDDEIRTTLAARYAELSGLLLGQPFKPQIGDVGERVRTNLTKAGLLA